MHRVALLLFPLSCVTIVGAQRGLKCGGLFRGLERMKIVIYTGKGGVGKTSVAAASALRCADLGHRTCVLSTDAAHSLADSLDIPLGPEPRQIADNLWAQEVDVHYSIQKHWGTFQKYLSGVLTGRGVDELYAEEFAVLPGLDEGAKLLWLNQYAAEERFDVVIIDAAPTAETLRLLSLPDVSRWWYERLFAVGQGASRLLRPVLSRTRVPLPNEKTFEAFEALFEQLNHIHDLLSDPAHSVLRLVVNAQRMVIKETQRTYTYVNLYGYVTDAVVCNRLLPAEIADDFFAGWKASQAANLQLIRECFAPLPVLTAPLFRQEMGGTELLSALADELFGEHDPSERFFEGRAHHITPAQGGAYVLNVPLPFADRKDLELYRDRDELTLRVGNQRRNFVLPRALWELQATQARFTGDTLQIHFVPPDQDDQQALDE
jgi:arsenite-transporting ATPase